MLNLSNRKVKISSNGRIHIMESIKNSLTEGNQSSPALLKSYTCNDSISIRKKPAGVIYVRDVSETLSLCRLFKQRKRFSGVKKVFPTAHLEVSNGSPQEAADYCKKDGDFVEYGCLPTTKSGGGAFTDILSKPEAGDIASIKNKYPGLYLRYKTNILSSYSQVNLS
ncbi:replication-associated protein [Caerostris darwini]|uniref:Replication-associated protein n=1 Tax=Caerostris darwini TaxID=1538125 RepID=A0AAV4R7V5_9ARAC|nr:replication-associated protein [Caerostris darwini]